MLAKIVKSAGLGMALGAALAFAAASQGLRQDQRTEQPAASGSSTAVPPGKVRLPELPLEPMPDTSMPKPPPVAPPPQQAASDPRNPHQL
jgi:hypothetical protein